MLWEMEQPDTTEDTGVLMDYEEEDPQVEIYKQGNPQSSLSLHETEKSEESEEFNYTDFNKTCDELIKLPDNDETSEKYYKTEACSNESNSMSLKPLKKRIQLRGYQEELASNAKQGKNVIICAPPGSGKTIIAASIIEDYLDRNSNSDKRVLFFTPTGALAQQQQNLMEKFLPEDYLSEFRCGREENSSLMLAANAHLIVLTPQILLNELESTDESKTFRELDEFGLLVFDECHHCFKGHPYNAVMKKYFRLKNENKSSELPQVVGLTATLGVGKNPKNIIEHMKQLCANLDAMDGIDTVQNEDHREELNEFSPCPKKKRIHAEERKNKEFYNQIIELMDELVTIIKEIEEISDPPTYNSDEESHRQEFMHWCQSQKNVIGQRDRADDRDAFSCVEYLEVCGNALDLYKKCRPVDVVDCLLEHVTKKEEFIEKLNEREIHLLDLTKATEQRLRESCHVLGYQNPDLKKVEDLIVKTFRDDENSRGLLMVETRRYALTLLKWMRETENLKCLDPKLYVGVANKSGAEISGLSHSKQEAILRNFREGKHKVLVCTQESTGEGLDFVDCNLVIKYHLMQNEIGMIQTIGRVRKGDGAMYNLTTARGEKRDELNLLKADLMEEAVKKIQKEWSDDDYKLREYLRQLQKLSREKDKIDLLKKIRKATRATDNSYELQCKKCKTHVCLSNDLRVAHGGHHIIIAEEFRKRYVRKTHNRITPMGNDWTKKYKVHCVECDNDWGIGASWKKFITVPLLKANSLRILATDGNHKPCTPRKWVEAPFEPQKVDLDEVLNELDHLLENEQ